MAGIAQRPALEKWSGLFSEIAGNMPSSYLGIVLRLARLECLVREPGGLATFRFIEDWIYLIVGVVCAVLVAL